MNCERSVYKVGTKQRKQNDVARRDLFRGYRLNVFKLENFSHDTSCRQNTEHLAAVKTTTTTKTDERRDIIDQG